MKRTIITGGAGFIGSNLVRRICKNKKRNVVILDNYSNGGKKLLSHSLNLRNVKLFKKDLSFSIQNNAFFSNADLVYHFSANSDIALSAKSTSLDYKQTLFCTYQVLEACREQKIKKLVFSSGSGVYGDLDSFSPNEKYGPLLPISMYGATKLGAEAMISAYSFLFDITSYVFRFANVVGPYQTHGVAFDFIKRLQKNPKMLVVLGNGLQSKSYIHVEDVIDAMLLAQQTAKERVNIFNVGAGDYLTVREIADIVLKEMKLKNTKLKFGASRFGWKGDVPKVRFNDRKIRKLGWKNRYTSREAVTHAVRAMLAGQIK